MTSAHVLELPPKMRYDAEMYAAGFVVTLAGVVLLVLSVLVETPRGRLRSRAA